MYNNIEHKLREIISMNDIPDLSPGGVVGDQPLPNGFKDAEIAEIVSPLEVLNRKILENYCQVCKK